MIYMMEKICIIDFNILAKEIRNEICFVCFLTSKANKECFFLDCHLYARITRKHILRYYNNMMTIRIYVDT